MTAILSIENLSKRYGKIQAVKNLSIEVHRGQVFGILGPNGSGKTTTLSVVLSLIKANAGSYRWFDEIPDKETRKRIGSVIESPNFFPYLTACQNLQLVAEIKGFDFDDIDRVLTLTDLYDRRNSRFKTFSFGMKQRLAVASALLGNPEVLIFDEPTNGLDPQGIAHIRNLIQIVAGEGTTIILASHLLDEVQKVCTHVAVLSKGTKLFDGQVSEVLAVSDCFELKSNDSESLDKWLKSLHDVDSISMNGDMFQVYFKGAITAEYINRECFNNGIVLSHLTERKRSLEQHFLELLEEHK